MDTKGRKNRQRKFIYELKQRAASKVATVTRETGIQEFFARSKVKFHFFSLSFSSRESFVFPLPDVTFVMRECSSKKTCKTSVKEIKVDGRCFAIPFHSGSAFSLLFRNRGCERFADSTRNCFYFSSFSGQNSVAGL